MEFSSSRLENEGEVESLCTQIPNDDDSTDEVGPEFELADKEDNEPQYKMIDANDKVEEPKESMMFDSLEEVEEYYKKYGQQVGFGVVKRTGKNGKDGSRRYITLTCIHQGKPNKGKGDCTKAIPKIIRTQCKARICATLCADGKWFLSNVVVEHNHCLSPGKTRFFRCYKNIDAAVKSRLELNDRAGIPTNKNFNSLVVEKGGYEQLTFGDRDCRNYIEKARELHLGKGGAQALRDYFSRMQKQNDGFYYVMDVDDDCRLRNVFWADARSRAAYEFFGDVITFDTTYLTNSYDMPFTPFVGMNHHGQSILLGAGLISNENTETYVWLFSTLLECMNGKAPSTIITDQDRAMKNAIAIVFAERTRHRYCLWHIMRKLPEKFAAHAQFNGIKSALNVCLYDSQSCDEFEESWKSLLETYKLQDNAWLNELYNERTFWVPAYMKDTFWAGMNIMQQSESMNAFFDGYVYSQTTLKEFVDHFDNALRRMVEKEKKADFDSFNHIIPCLTPYPLEEKFQDVYTNAKFKEVQGEFMKVVGCNNSRLTDEGAISTYQVIEIGVINRNMKDISHCVYYNEEEVEVKCTCALFETRGILCRHAISVLLSKKVSTLPPRFFLTRWRKDLKRTYTLLKSSYDNFGGNSDDERYDSLSKNLNELLSLGSNGKHIYTTVMKRVDVLKEECRKLSCISVASSSCNEASTLQSNNLLSPVKVKRKERPPIGRMVPIVEQAAKKKSQVTNKPSTDNNTKTSRSKKQTSKAKQDQANKSQTPLPSIIDDQHGHLIRTQVGVPVDPTGELSRLVDEHNFERAFHIAISRCDLSIMSWLCSQVDLRWILSVVPLPLSQGVLLQLLWRLACDFSNNPSQKLAWMTVVANAIIPTDPAIAVHVQPILFQVYNILNHRSTLPTQAGVERSNIHFLINVINSMIMTSK